MAEEEGFEPPDPFGSAVFKTAALDRSATPPLCEAIHRPQLPRQACPCYTAPMPALLLAAALAAAGNVYIQPMASYGTPTWARLSGRVLEGTPPPPPDAARGKLDNFVDTLATLESDEVAGAKVQVKLFGKAHEATTDADGVFVIEARGKTAMEPGVHRLEVRLADTPVKALVELYVLREKPAVAVISDVDDTIVKTHVTRPVSMVAQVLTKNAAQLEPTPGMPPAYRAWHKQGAAAFFYLSASPQNLYPRLRAFVEAFDYPLGPILVKNIGEDSLDQPVYKLGRLEQIFNAFPQLRFVLVGDSGESDPDIFKKTRDKFPERVVAIVIRELANRPVADRQDIVFVREDGTDAEALARLLAP